MDNLKLTDFDTSGFKGQKWFSNKTLYNLILILWLFKKPEVPRPFKIVFNNNFIKNKKFGPGF